MADQEADQLEAGTEDLEEKSSISYMMEHPEEETDLSVAGQDQETPEQKAAREAEEAETAAAEAAAEAGGETETPEQKAAREAAEAEADKTKGWTEEDFRRGYKEAETRMHAATEETAKEKAAREAAEARAEAAEAKLAEQDAERERLAAEAAKPKPMTEEDQDAIFEKAAAELADLDQSSPDYLKDYAKIWRRAINAAGQNRTPPDPETTAEEIATKAWEKIQAKQAEDKVKTEEERRRDRGSTYRKKRPRVGDQIRP